MERFISRSVSGIQWRSSAFLKSMRPDRARQRLSPPGMAWERLGLPLRTVALLPGDFLLPVDFQADFASRAGTPISGDLLSTQYESGWAGDEQLVQLLQNQGQAAINEQVVVVGLKDGRWMVLHGERVVAAAFKVGLDVLSVQETPLGEALASITDRQKTFFPKRRYRRNLDLLDRLGLAEKNQNTAMMALAEEFRKNPLVRKAPIYQPLPFPEFQNLETQASTEASYARLGMILDHLPDPKGKKVLDLGCNIGFFLFSMAFRGCRVSGLDLETRFVEVGRQVAAAKGIDVDFVAAALEPDSFQPEGALGALRDHPANDPDGTPWDLITSFSMLQWVEKLHDLEYCRAILKEISLHTKAFLVDIPVNCSGVHMKAPVGREISWLEEFLRDSCDFQEYSYVGTVAPYKVDPRHVFYCRH